MTPGHGRDHLARYDRGSRAAPDRLAAHLDRAVSGSAATQRPPAQAYQAGVPSVQAERLNTMVAHPARCAPANGVWILTCRRGDRQARGHGVPAGSPCSEICAVEDAEAALPRRPATMASADVRAGLRHGNGRPLGRTEEQLPPGRGVRVCTALVAGLEVGRLVRQLVVSRLGRRGAEGGPETADDVRRLLDGRPETV